MADETSLIEGSRHAKSSMELWRMLVLFLAILQVYPLAAMQVAPVASLSAAAQKIKDQISRIPIDGKLTVKKLEGTDYHGRLESIDPKSFSMSEVDLKTTVTIAYSDVEQVRKNYGGKGIGGHRVDPRRSLIVGAILLGTMFTILLVALAKS